MMETNSYEILVTSNRPTTPTSKPNDHRLKSGKSMNVYVFSLHKNGTTFVIDVILFKT